MYIYAKICRQEESRLVWMALYQKSRNHLSRATSCHCSCIRFFATDNAEGWGSVWLQFHYFAVIFIFLSIYQFIHFITYALQYMALFSVQNTKLHKQQCLLHSTSRKTQEFPTPLARPYPRPHASPETRPTSLKARCVSRWRLILESASWGLS